MDTATNSEKGFTLMECMIAVTVLTISFLGLAQLMTVSLQQNAFSRYNTMAVEVAQKKLEVLRTKFNNELETETSDSNLTAGSHPSGSPGYELLTLTAPSYSNIGDSQFQVSWTVTISGKQKTVSVTVDPQTTNELTSASLSITTIFSP
ncbi:prepilin-type N-terminal cleavage/methylation domain-containing protein [Acidobacteria bacterium AH-259-D05]|nr:prepilin-type N-terminal cleavage/methylation domain-containing protein [Acidobacteria bacterium AH-259-D05]